MIMSGLHFKNEIPFSEVYFTSIIRDDEGRKMSKSLGNSPDALELFDEYGVDAVRMSILMIAPQGTDVLFSVDRLDQGRNFMNKLWNCSRFLLMNIENSKSIKSINDINYNLYEPIDFWIFSRLNQTIKEVNKYLKSYKLNEAIKTMYNFIWKDYCDWYIEFSKSRIYGLDSKEKEIVVIIAVDVLKNILKLLHPYTPFITEEIWSYFQLNKTEFIINQNWPRVNNKLINIKVEDEMHFVMSIISAIRNLKSELNISPKKEINLVCRGDKIKTQVILDNNKYFNDLVKVNNIKCYEKIDKPEKSSTLVINDIEIFIPLEDLIDIDKEIIRLQDKINDYQGRMNSVKKKINNENFVKRAPKEIVEHEKNKYINYKNNINKLKENLDNLLS